MKKVNVLNSEEISDLDEQIKKAMEGHQPSFELGQTISIRRVKNGYCLNMNYLATCVNMAVDPEGEYVFSDMHSLTGFLWRAEYKALNVEPPKGRTNANIRL